MTRAAFKTLRPFLLFFSETLGRHFDCIIGPGQTSTAMKQYEPEVVVANLKKKTHLKKKKKLERI